MSLRQRWGEEVGLQVKGTIRKLTYWRQTTKGKDDEEITRNRTVFIILSLNQLVDLTPVGIFRILMASRKITCYCASTIQYVHWWCLVCVCVWEWVFCTSYILEYCPPFRKMTGTKIDWVPITALWCPLDTQQINGKSIQNTKIKTAVIFSWIKMKQSKLETILNKNRNILTVTNFIAENISTSSSSKNNKLDSGLCITYSILNRT